MAVIEAPIAKARFGPFGIGATIVAILFVMDDIVGLLDGGGLFSVTRAIDHAGQAMRFIDVDGAGLRTPFVALCTILAANVASLVRIDITRKLPSFLFMSAAIGGGFAVDAAFGGRIVDEWMGDRGYSRCIARDHVVGQGKSRVWFDGYVRRRADCLEPVAAAMAPAPMRGDPRTANPRPAMPVASPASWFTSDDYPALALRRGTAGAVSIAFVIERDGHVDRCRVTRSSRSPILDATTCGVYANNARYWPARDANGRPVPEDGTQTVRWQVPTG